jgi:hypothetical protein
VELVEGTSYDNAGALISYVVVEHPMGGIGKDAITEKAEKAFPDILEAATKWQPEQADAEKIKQEEFYPAETFEFEGTTKELNKMFIEKGWSAGIPIVPPTPEKVEAMLEGTTRAADEVVWEVPPRKGMLTVELVATYAVMAGCEPEYMPVILGILDAMTDPEFNWAGLTATTHPNGILAVVNGPIAEEIGLASGTGAAGGFYQANASIGYAVALITDVVGGSKPPKADLSSQGWSGNIIATVVAENTEESPWNSYSEEKGYTDEDNIVTVFAGGPPVNIADHSSVGVDGVLRAFADSVTYAGQNTECAIDNDVVLLMNPEFAGLIAEAGYDKDQFKEWLWENARKPAGDYPDMCADCASETLGTDVDDDTPVPTVSEPEHYQIFVVGGQGKHSQYWPGFAHYAFGLQDKTIVIGEISK